jgi:DNA-binding response OmpR family regulator
MLTARTTEDDKLLGLDLGADDYVTKPFSPRELLARVRAVLRRVAEAREPGPSTVRVGELAVDFAGHTARLSGTPLRLTPKEFKLLETLVREPGRAFSRLELLERVFGYDYEGLERTVDVHMMNLRKKIERDPTQPVYLLTVYGVGYKFADDLEAV